MPESMYVYTYNVCHMELDHRVLVILLAILKLEN